MLQDLYTQYRENLDLLVRLAQDFTSEGKRAFLTQREICQRLKQEICWRENAN